MKYVLIILAILFVIACVIECAKKSLEKLMGEDLVDLIQTTIMAIVIIGGGVSGYNIFVP